MVVICRTALKIAYPFTRSCIPYTRALALSGKVIEFAPLFACNWLAMSMNL